VIDVKSATTGTEFRSLTDRAFVPLAEEERVVLLNSDSELTHEVSSASIYPNLIRILARPFFSVGVTLFGVGLLPTLKIRGASFFMFLSALFG